jgi:hypothetical protein
MLERIVFAREKQLSCQHLQFTGPFHQPDSAIDLL